MATTDMVTAFSSQGRRLLNSHDVQEAHHKFYSWDSSVASWLDDILPDSGLSAQWSALPVSNLIFGNYYATDLYAWRTYRQAVQVRLRFLANVATALRAPRVQAGEGSADKTTAPTSIASGKVFLVQGRDETRCESVARFVEKLGLKPVVLHFAC